MWMLTIAAMCNVGQMCTSRHSVNANVTKYRRIVARATPFPQDAAHAGGKDTNPPSACRDIERHREKWESLTETRGPRNPTTTCRLASSDREQLGRQSPGAFCTAGGRGCTKIGTAVFNERRQMDLAATTQAHRHPLAGGSNVLPLGKTHQCEHRAETASQDTSLGFADGVPPVKHAATIIVTVSLWWCWSCPLRRITRTLGRGSGTGWGAGATCGP